MSERGDLPENSPSSREKLILDHLPQVRYIACKIHRKLPRTVLLEDIISCGTIGLIQAVDAWRPDSGATLKTFAERRIHGEIIDSLRKADWAPRIKRREWKRIREVRERLSMALEREPTEEEIASELGVEVKRYRRLARGEVGGLGKSLEVLKMMPAPEDSPEEIAAMAEVKAVLRYGVLKLTVKQRETVRMCFYCDMEAVQVARDMGVQQSAVSLMKAKAVERLGELVGWKLK